LKNILGQYTIEKIQPQVDGTPSKIKVKVRLNRNGIFDVTQASLIETIEEPNAQAGPGKIHFFKKDRFTFILFYRRNYGNSNIRSSTKRKWR